MSDSIFTFGCRQDDPDDRDYIVVDTLARLKEELAKLQQQGIKIGSWKPNRDKKGEPTNYEVEIYQVDPHQTNRTYDKEILVPLKPSISRRLSENITKITLHLPSKFLLYRSLYNNDQENILGKALVLNGINTYVEFSNKDVLQQINFDKFQEFMIELWVKSDSMQTYSQPRYASILEKWNGNIKKGYPFSIRYDNKSGKIVCSRSDGNYNQPQVISRRSIDDGEFHHIAFVKRDAILYLYIDGLLEDRTPDTIHDYNSSQEHTQNSSNLYLGCRGDKVNLFQGQIYLIRIWNKHFKENDVKNEYFQTSDISQESKNYHLLFDLNFFNLSQGKLNEILKEILNSIITEPDFDQKSTLQEIVNDMVEKILKRPIQINTIHQDILNELKTKNEEDISEELKLILEATRKYFQEKPTEIKKKILEKIFHPFQLVWSNNNSEHSHDDNDDYKHYFSLKFLDFNNWSAVKEQSKLPSCTVHAAVSLLEYFERKVSGRYQDYSILFLYIVAFSLSSQAKDTSEGLSIREVMSAMMTFGVPPEKYFPSNEPEKYFPTLTKQEPKKEIENTIEQLNIIENVPKKKDDGIYPLPFIYNLAQKYKAKSYFRLDQPNIVQDKRDLADSIKIFISAGFPPMFGFKFSHYAYEFSDKHQGEISFDIKNPSNNHAVIAVGYDDDMLIETNIKSEDFKDLNNDYIEINSDDSENLEIIKGDNFIEIKAGQIYTKGALRIRNSWGVKWGDKGYGWLPYAYILAGLTFDWWSMLKAEWLDTDYFGISQKDYVFGTDPIVTPPGGISPSNKEQKKKN